MDHKLANNERKSISSTSESFNNFKNTNRKFKHSNTEYKIFNNFDFKCKTDSKKEQFKKEFRNLTDFIHENFIFEANIMIILENAPKSIENAKKHLNNIFYEFQKKIRMSKITYGLIFIDFKKEEVNISQPIKDFTKNSNEQLKNFIESIYMRSQISEYINQLIEKKLKIDEALLSKLFKMIEKLKWTTKKTKICLFFIESFESNMIEILDETIKNFENNNDLKTFFLTSEKPDEEKKEIIYEKTIKAIVPSIKNFNILLGDHIQKTCLKLDLKNIEEKFKKNVTENTFLETKSTSQKIKKNFLELSFDESKPNFFDDNKEIFEATAHSFFIVKDKSMEIDWSNPLIQSSFIKTQVWINPKPFAAGCMRYAFYMKDIKLNEKLVGKIPKEIDENYTIPHMRQDIESLIVLSHLSCEFNKRIIAKFQKIDQNLINAVNSYIYEIASPTNYPYKYLWVENLLEGEYKKYNNNVGWIDNSEDYYNELVQAFSHFTFQFTSGYLLIVDLQGPYGILTDPQIHCRDIDKYGKGNFGNWGIAKFFITHKCNEFCQGLGLIHVNQQEKEEWKDDFWEKTDNMKKIFENHDSLVRLCDLCRLPYKFTKNDYFKRYDKFFHKENEDYCTLCLKKFKESKKSGGFCCDCGEKFHYSEYWFEKKRTEPPVRCAKCRYWNREKKREELYSKQKTE